MPIIDRSPTTPTVSEFGAANADILIRDNTGDLYVLNRDGGVVKVGPTNADGSTFVQSGTGAIARTVQAKEREQVSITDFAANGVSGSAVDPAGVLTSSLGVQAAVNAALFVHSPPGTYALAAPAADQACVRVSTDNTRLTGAGPGAIWSTSANAAVPLHVSTEADLDVAPTTEVSGFVCDNLSIRGTGTYENFALAYGRGVLLRKVKDAVVRDCFISDMSMIGVVAEWGTGKFIVDGNVITNCKYGAVNYNGRCYQSIISNNICFGSDGSVDSAAIQATGHCEIIGNTIFGSVADYANAGGIVWGEGNYTGIGLIANNLVKHCRFGIKTIYHGPANITGNTIINCRTTSGILAVGGTDTGLTVASSDNLIASNLLINNYPEQINCGVSGALIQGNRCLYISTVVQPLDANAPDAVTVVRPEYGIYVTADNVSVVGNTITGAIRGLVVKQGVTLGEVYGNDVTGTSSGVMAIESDNNPGTICALHDLITRKSAGGGVYTSVVFGNTKPSQGFWEVGDTWERIPASVGSSLGEKVIVVTSDKTVAVQAVATDTVIQLNATTDITSPAGNVVGIELDNGVYHWTTVTNVASPNITIGAAIPASRTANIGARVYWIQWAALANL